MESFEGSSSVSIESAGCEATTNKNKAAGSEQRNRYPEIDSLTLFAAPYYRHWFTSSNQLLSIVSLADAFRTTSIGIPLILEILEEAQCRSGRRDLARRPDLASIVLSIYPVGLPDSYSVQFISRSST